MNPERRFVFDTNVLLSAFLFKQSTPRQAFDLALSLGSIVHSDETLSELWEVLVRPKFDHFLTLEERMTLLKGFEQISSNIRINTHVAICRDPKDNKFLNLALSAQAQSIISGDQDLLTLSTTFPVQILTAKQFLEWKN